MLATALIAVTISGGSASGSPQAANPIEPSLQSARPDSLPNPRGESQEQLKKEAIARLIKGTATTELRNGSEVVSMGRGRWVELKKKADKVDPIFTILVQFGNQTDPLTGGTAGPAHNQIAEPDRSVDNSTLWQSDFTPNIHATRPYSKDRSLAQRRRASAMLRVLGVSPGRGHGLWITCGELRRGSGKTGCELSGHPRTVNRS